MVVMDLLNRYKDLSESDKESLYNYKRPECIKDMLYLSIDMETNEIETAIKRRVLDDGKKIPLVTNEELLIREGYEVVHRGYHNSESYLSMLFVSKVGKSLVKSDLIDRINKQKASILLDDFNKFTLRYSLNNTVAIHKLDVSVSKKDSLENYDSFLETNFKDTFNYINSIKREQMLDKINEYIDVNFDYINDYAKTKLDALLAEDKKTSYRLCIYFKGFEELMLEDDKFYILKKVFDSTYSNFVFVNDNWFFVPITNSTNIREKYVNTNRNNMIYATGLIPLEDVYDFYSVIKYRNLLFDSHNEYFKALRVVYLDKWSLKLKTQPSIGDFILTIYDSNKGSIDFYSNTIYMGDSELKLISYYTSETDGLYLNDINGNSLSFIKLFANKFLDSIMYSGNENKDNKFLDFKSLSKPSSKLHSLFLRDGKYIIENLERFSFNSPLLQRRILNLINDSINIQCLEVRDSYSLFNKLLLKLGIESDIKGVNNKVLVYEDKKNSLVGRLSSEDFSINDLEEYLLLAGSILRYQLSFTSKQDSEKAIYKSNLVKKKSVKAMNKYLSDLDGRFHATITESKNYKKARVAMLNFEDSKIDDLSPIWYALYNNKNIISKPINN